MSLQHTQKLAAKIVQKWCLCQVPSYARVAKIEATDGSPDSVAPIKAGLASVAVTCLQHGQFGPLQHNPCENFLYVFKGARSAPVGCWPPHMQ